MLPLVILSGTLAYCAIRSGGIEVSDLSLAVFLVACSAAAHYGFVRQQALPRFPKLIRRLLFLLPAYVVFQVIPLPMPVLTLLSPARATLLRAAGPVLNAPMHWAPLSLVPGIGFDHALRIIACIVLLCIIREIALQHPARPWLVIAPIVAIASVEALIGILQYIFVSGVEVRGTWLNRNHFASFLAMCVPFPAAYAIAVLNRSPKPNRAMQFRGVALVCTALCIAAFLLYAVMRSLSRMGFASAIVALLVCGTAFAYAHLSDVGARWRRLAIVSALPVAAFVALLALAPPELVSRFIDLDFANGMTMQDRFQLWRESRPLLSEYSLFGTGLGGYESAFLRHKTTSPLVRDEFAHNDYLQFLIELGIAGFVVASILAASILARTARGLTASAIEDRALAAACCGSFAAIMLHSVVDFNLYVPANGFLLAWVVGVASTLDSSFRRRSRAHMTIERVREGPAAKIVQDSGAHSPALSHYVGPRRRGALQ